MNYARLLVETGWTPEILDQVGIQTIMNMILYKEIKNIAIHGGNWNG